MTTAVLVLMGLVILLLLILVAGLLRSHAEILRQLHALGASTDGVATWRDARSRTTGHTEAPATEISGVEPSGASRSISLKSGRGETLLAFLSSGCASCQTFWDALRAGPEMPTPTTRTVIVTKGTSAESPGTLADLAPSDMPIVMSDDAWDAFRVPLTPYFMLLDSDSRVVGEGSAPSWERLVDLLRQSLADTAEPVHLDTDQRERFTDQQLYRSGIEPGDPSLYHNPTER